MTYPRSPDLKKLTDELSLYAQLKSEHGAKGISKPLANAERALKFALTELKRLPIDKELAKQEPNALTSIQALRSSGPRRIWDTFDKQAYGGHSRQHCGCCRRQARHSGTLVRKFQQYHPFVSHTQKALLDQWCSKPIRETGKTGSQVTKRCTATRQSARVNATLG